MFCVPVGYKLVKFLFGKAFFFAPVTNAIAEQKVVDSVAIDVSDPEVSSIRGKDFLLALEEPPPNRF